MTTAQQGQAVGLTAQFAQYQGGPAADVTNLTIAINRVADSAVILAATSAGISHLGTGTYGYTWSVPDSLSLGDYLVTWLAAEGSALETVTVTAGTGAAETGEGWTPNTGLINNWASFSATVQTYAVDLATSVLWGATGRQFGLTDLTIRPCWNPQMPTYITYPSIWNAGQYGGQYAWGLFAFSGNFALLSSCGCGLSTQGSACGCDPPQIELPMPVYQIIAVVENGVTLAPSVYRVDGNALVRQDGSSWNYRQNLAAPLGGQGTWSVRYLRGKPVPQAVNDAAGILAGEFAKGVTGQSCRLPQRMVSMSRQGVTAQFVNFQDALSKGFTGVLEVDMVIRTYNPRGLTHRPRVLTPDGPQFRQVSP